MNFKSPDWKRAADGNGHDENFGCKTCWLPCLLMLVTMFSGCSVTPRNPYDVRTALLDSAKKSEPNFPDGHELLLTHFSYLGRLVTSQGDVIYVVDQRGVVADQPAPHGQNFIAFFDRHFRYLGKISYVQSRPLWCEGSRLYLFGNLDGFPQSGQSFLPGGNVIDVARGYQSIRSYHAKVYGSSGGTDD
ncbi:MAG TPA: hypothetical protein VGY56_13285 [Verrucomicrobiae bacterium]|nr:hypothetical protein [Verrucomicrobiae bacterium]